ncbi:hypothetical protein ABMC89_13490 [Sulfitobacter sp. HNIBRBA3233]|uniref:hypothetical protein n=1 Tax=Sulfitobacter marinivivus TaxID=3158558 RepID=UPI0032E01B6C
MSDHQEDTSRPITKHRDGAVEVAIWRRETDNGPVYNTERSRSYRDQDGNWQNTSVIPERDLLKAARLDQKAYESIQQMRDQERAKYVEQQTGRQRARDQGRER